MNTAQTIVLVVSILSVVVGALLIIGFLAESAKARKEEEKNAPQKVGWWARKTPAEKRGLTFVFGALGFCVFVVLVIVLGELNEGSSGSSSHRLSEATRREIFYNMVKTQDQNPYSNEWNEGVKQAAAKSYNVPMSEINALIREGAMNNWLTPPPP